MIFPSILRRVGSALSTVPKTMKNSPIDVSLSETNHAVDVVPTFAPSKTPRLERNDMDPVSTNATVSVVTALLDWTIAEATAPNRTPRQRLSVSLPSHLFRVAPPTLWISWLKPSKPYRKSTIAETLARKILRFDISVPDQPHKVSSMSVMHTAFILKLGSVPSSEFGDEVGQRIRRMSCEIHSLRWESDSGSLLFDDIHDIKKQLFLNLKKVCPVTDLHIGKNV